MTPPRSAPTLFAPGASTHAAYAPGREKRLPAVDERLVAPESHAEIVDGVVYRTMGSNQPHGTRHFAAAHVFAGALADGYEGAVDMLTRADEDTDAAPDISVFPEGEDEVTGGRKREGEREGQREGALRASRAALLTLLGARGALSEAQRARVAACDDEATLVAWFGRAVAGEGAAAILGA